MLKNVILFSTIVLLFSTITADAQIKPAQSQYLEEVGAFINPSFEQGYKGWTDTGTCTKSLNSTIPYLNKSYRLSCTAQDIDLKQEISVLNYFPSMKYVASCYVSATGADITIESLLDGATDKTYTVTNGSSEHVVFRGDIGSTSNGIKVSATGITGTFEIDDCSLKIDKSVFSTGDDGSFLVKDSSQPRGVKFDKTLSGVFNPVTNWQTFTPTGTWTNTTYDGYYRQIGDSVELTYRLSLTGVPAGGQLRLDLPFGWEIDSTKIGFPNVRVVVGESVIYDASSASRIAIPRIHNSTSIRLEYDLGSTLGNVTNTTPIAFTTSDSIDIRVRVPIVGLSASTSAIVQNKTLINVKYRKTSAQDWAQNTTETILYDTFKEDNSGGMYNPSTGVFTNTSGEQKRFKVCASVLMQSTTWGANTAASIIVNKSAGSDTNLERHQNPNVTSSLFMNTNGCDKIILNAGEDFRIDFLHNTAATQNLYTSSDAYNYLAISEIPNNYTLAGTFKKCQLKELSANITTDTVDIADLRFTGLKIGNTYTVNMHYRVVASVVDGESVLSAINGASSICDAAVTTHNLFVNAPRHSPTCSFTAAATNLTANIGSLGVGNTVTGGSTTTTNTRIELCEENIQYTTEW